MGQRDGTSRTSGVGASGRRGALLPRVLVGVPCVVAAVAVGVVFALSWSSLPDPMAMHFGAGGDSNGSGSPLAVFLMSELVLLCLGVGLSRSAVRGSRSLRALYMTSAASAVGLGYLLSVAVLVNAGADSAIHVRMPMWHLAVAVGAVVVVAGVARVLTSDELPEGAGHPKESRSIGLRQGERAVWVRSIGPRWLVGAGLLAAVAAVAAGGLGWHPGYWLWPVGLLLAALAAARVTVDGEGLTVRLPLLRVPRIQVPLQRIERAWVAQARPLPDLGGWGYRITQGRRGLALHAGEAVWLDLDDGKQFVVVVDDAATAAGLLGDLLTAAEGRRSS